MALAELRDSYKFSYNAEIEFAVGAAVKSLGPQVVLSAIPLQVCPCFRNDIVFYYCHKNC